MIPQYTLSLVDMWIHVMLKVNIGNNFGYIYILHAQVKACSTLLNKTWTLVCKPVKTTTEFVFQFTV